ncbi:hypothetical protein FRC08_010622 [Ceratobasidium sp. 394]|nr:hypothetical protein FRC08_010622 [Ceratobasidium sp. 394]KAG9101303.1 hypothetical protein FS749_008023 [Ceratobasidium sp. UAMH 11750]
MRLSLYSTFLGAGFATLVSSTDPFALPPGFHQFAERAQGINWQPCGDNGSRQCGRFEVPLDYQNATAGKASLAVARLRATRQPKIGTLFVNPGGPGGSGVDMILDGAEDIMETAGGRYDVVSWDPRGIGLSRPKVGCFQTGEEEFNFWNNTIPFAGIEAKGNFTDPGDLSAFYDQVPQVDVLLKKIGEKCIATSPDTYQYIGSAAAVRDMLALNDYLEGPNKTVDFWGLSYGTIIGVYFANMFPDRVGRVVLDGVVDPEIWANRPAHELWNRTINSVDAAFDGFVAACAAAGPSGCAIASKNSSADSVKQTVLQLIDRAYDLRKSVGPDAELYSADVRNVLYNGLYSPTSWPDLAKELKDMSNILDNPRSSRPRKKRFFMRPRTRIRRNNGQNNGNGGNNRNGNSNDNDRNGNDNNRNGNEGNANNDPPSTDYAFQAVACADAADPGNITTKAVFDSLVDSARTASPIFGQLWSEAGLYCHNWPVRAVERFTGPFNKTLSNKIIVVGNEADPSTPFLSAKNVADALGDSAILIEQDDFGHISLAMHSDCTQGALTDYFLNNTLPSSDKFCGTNQVLFPGPGITKNTLSVLAASGASDSTELQAELDKARAYGRNMTVAVIVLVCTVALLLMALILSFVRGRKVGARTRVTYVTPEALEKAVPGKA